MNTQPEPLRLPSLSMFDCDHAIEIFASVTKILRAKGETEMLTLKITTDDLFSGICMPRYLGDAPNPGDKLLGVSLEVAMLKQESPVGVKREVYEDICVTHTLKTEDGQAVMSFLGTEGTQGLPFDPVPACPAGKSLHWFVDNPPDSLVAVSVHLEMLSYWESGQ